MKLPQNITGFLKQLPLKKMKGEEVFVAIVFFLANGKKNKEIETKNVKSKWSKTLIGKKYNPAFSNRAQGNLNPCSKGQMCLTSEGFDYIESLFQSVSLFSTGLKVFTKGSSHSFDKFIRSVFKKATKNIDVADTYVSGAIFDNLLDEASKDVPIRFLYGNDVGGFISKSKRFAREYSFNAKQSSIFHDRFIVVDDKGYIMGPSLKDAADKKPATLVVLGSVDSKKLINLFLGLWGSK